MYIYIYIYTYKYVYVYMCAYIYTYIHTYILCVVVMGRLRGEVAVHSGRGVAPLLVCMSKLK